MGKSTISMAIFNSYVKLPEGTTYFAPDVHDFPPAQTKFFNGVSRVGRFS